MKTLTPFFAALVFLAVLLTGCAVGPDYKTPETAVPDRYEQASAPVTMDPPVELKRWWFTLQDPVLNDLVARALDDNHDLRVAASKVRQARAARTISTADFLPSLGASGSVERSRRSETTSSSFTAFGADAEQTLYTAAFDASWEIDLFGGRRREAEAADALLGATIENGRDVMISLIAETARNYVELRSLQNRLAVARDAANAQQQTADLIRARAEAGMASELDVVQADAAAAAASAVPPLLEQAVSQTTHRIALLLGKTPNALAGSLQPSAPLPKPATQPSTGLPRELLRRRPDIRRAERELAAATARVGVATADLFPRFSLTGSFGGQSADSGDVFKSASRIWGFGPAVSWNLFNAGKVRAGVEIRSAEQEQALLLYEKTVYTALGEVEDSLAAYTRELQRREALARAVAANERAVTLSTDLYDKGAADFLRVLDAQRGLYSARDAALQNNAATLTALIALYKSLGGGWDDGEN